MRKPNCFLCARIMRYGALSIAHLTGSGPFKLLCSNATSLSCSDRLSTDELRQGYNFLCPCAVYPKGRKSSRKTCYFHTLGIMVRNRLNAMGIKTRLGYSWSRSPILKLLRNYAYTGNLILQTTYGLFRWQGGLYFQEWD